jgi:hypothetical protein
MKRVSTLAFALTAILVVGSLAAVNSRAASRSHGVPAATAAASTDGHGEEEPRILMGSTQKEHWESGAAECPGLGRSYCADQISQGQFVAWPFIAEHTGTVEAIFAVLSTSQNTGAEIGIYANRKYSYPEIKYVGSEGGAKETWTPARFKEYESEIPPEDPGKLLGTSGKVAEDRITNEGWTEFRLEKPVKVTKGERYWLTNTAFASPSSATTRYYQDFYHERESTTKDQPWGNYSNEPLNYFKTARPLKELPSPETTKINCEKCDTEGWLQEEPKQFELLNANRGAQEEGGQTYSYAYGEVEEGPAVVTTAATVIEGEAATLNATVNPKGTAVTECKLEYGTASLYELTEGYEASVPCASSPGSGDSPVAVSASIGGLSKGTDYDFRIVATNAVGTSYGRNQAFTTFGAEYGRCLKAPAEKEGNKTVYHGGFTTAKCVVESSTHTGHYEWEPGVEESAFETKLAGGSVRLESAVKAANVTCSGETSAGEYTGASTVGGVALSLTGCEQAGARCSSAGAESGEIETNTLEGALGVIALGTTSATNKIGLDLYPVGKAGPLMEFACASTTVSVQGSVIVPVTADRALLSTKLKATASKGQQKPESLVGGPQDVLEESVDGAAFEPTGLSFTITQTNEEEVEVNSVL